MQIKIATADKNSSCTSTLRGVRGTRGRQPIAADGKITITVNGVAEKLSFVVTGDLEVVEQSEVSCTVQPVAASRESGKGKGAFEVRAGDQPLHTIDIEVGGKVTVGLMIGSFG